MFVSKRKIRKRHFFYLEATLLGKRLSLSLGQKEQAKERLEAAFDSLTQKMVLESLKETQKSGNARCLSLDELIALERLKADYKLLKDFFPQEFERFKEDEFARYAQGSASVEGNSLSLQEASIVLSKGIAISGKKIDEIREIENMRFAAEESKKIKGINEKNIRKIHSAIMRGFGEKKPGEYRDGPMFITGSSVRPPSAEKIREEISLLLNWYEKNKNITHPVELAAEFHARFEEIHPFLDGNGRIGREILNLMLQKAGYPRAIINLENRESYIVLLERLQTNKEYNKFSKFIFLCLEKRAEEISVAIKENKRAIIKEFLAKIR